MYRAVRWGVLSMVAAGIGACLTMSAARAAPVAGGANASPLAMRQTFIDEVPRRLKVPPVTQAAYADILERALTAGKVGGVANEYVVLVDRNPFVEALFIYFRGRPTDTWRLIGAAPVSTGRPGSYDHFVTPTGVFAHTPANMDYRAEGTLNENKIRGYGEHGMRIYDFGWQQGERGWGKGGFSQMRLQMHSTDPDKLEPLLGMRHSKGCVRIPGALNQFFDRHGILDADYNAQLRGGRSLWVLKPEREATPWAGHYLVVVDTRQHARPYWSPLPDSRARAQMPAHADTAD
ncbi:MAG: L,D-transpeptidase [Janthinobacterium lividum]